MRIRDPTVHNVIANHPDTISGLHWHGEGYLTFDNLADDPNYYLLHNGEREVTVDEVASGTLPADFPTLALIFEFSVPGVWEVHTMSLPHARGNLVHDAKSLMHEMFVQHGADMIWGRASVHNIAARKFNIKLGGEPCGFSTHPVVGEVEMFRNSRARWLRDHWNNANR